MRHRSCVLSALMLVLAVGGLLLMHGVDSPGHLLAAADDSPAPHSGRAAAEGDHDAASGAAVGPGTSEGREHHDVLGHVMATCTAVLAGVAGGTVLRRLWLLPLPVPVVLGAAVRASAPRARDDLRPPAPDRLMLCLLRI